MEKRLKVLNLYAGIGGNRKLWRDVDVIAVEINPEIAKIYQDFMNKKTSNNTYSYHAWSKGQ